VEVSIGFGESAKEENIYNACGSQYKVVTTKIDNDIITMSINGHITKDIHLCAPKGEKYISLCFILSGNVTSFNEDGSVDIRYSKGDSYIVFHSDFVGSTTIHKTEKLSVFSIVMPYDFLHRVFENTSRKKIIQLLKCQEEKHFFQKEIFLTPYAKGILHQISEAKPKEELKFFFAASKTYELINCCLEELSEDCPRGCGLSVNDLSCLKKARIILSENIAEPPSIINLSRMVGINDCKLKRGFKMVFNTTPFGYVQELRMAQAKQLFIDGTPSVTFVANQVGYTNVGHFSAAFRKFYGTTPGVFKKMSIPMIT